MFVWIVFFLSNLYFVHLLFCKIHNIPLDGRHSALIFGIRVGTEACMFFSPKINPGSQGISSLSTFQNPFLL
jgi:hypothetical protein